MLTSNLFIYFNSFDYFSTVKDFDCGFLFKKSTQVALVFPNFVKLIRASFFSLFILNFLVTEFPRSLSKIFREQFLLSSIGFSCSLFALFRNLSKDTCFKRSPLLCIKQYFLFLICRFWIIQYNFLVSAKLLFIAYNKFLEWTWQILLSQKSTQPQHSCILWIVLLSASISPALYTETETLLLRFLFSKFVIYPNISSLIVRLLLVVRGKILFVQKREHNFHVNFEYLAAKKISCRYLLEIRAVPCTKHSFLQALLRALPL